VTGVSSNDPELDILDELSHLWCGCEASDEKGCFVSAHATTGDSVNDRRLHKSNQTV
jgi:hypothetical protein